MEFGTKAERKELTIKVLLRFRLKERVVHSIGFTQKKDKLEFGGLAAQTSSPPALVRGVVRVAHTGTGGSPSPAYLSQKRTKK